MPDCFVYIITNKNRSTLYIVVTNDLARRMGEHRSKEVRGFSADYSLSILLYYETYPDAPSAIAREKQLKGWRREKKVKLIEQVNPRWMDLSAALEQPEIVRGPSTSLHSAQDDGEGPAAGPEFL
jgi:putative endonuclease